MTSSGAPTRLLPSQPAANGVRGATDALVQGALVDLFAAYGNVVAPLPRTLTRANPVLPDVSAAVGFSRLGVVGLPGRLTLSLPYAVLELMKAGESVKLKGDWARELANQLTGRIKNRLLQFNVRLQVGASSVIDRSQLTRQLLASSNARWYEGRTLRGNAVVTLEGLPEDSELVYVGPAKIASEGAAILF